MPSLGRNKAIKCDYTGGECGLDFHIFFAIRKHKQSLHKIKKQSSQFDYFGIEFDTIMVDHVNQKLRNELSCVKHSPIDSESFRGKQKFQLCSNKIESATDSW